MELIIWFLARIFLLVIGEYWAFCVSCATIFAAKDDMGEIPPLIDLTLIHKRILNFANDPNAKVAFSSYKPIKCRALCPGCVRSVPGLGSRVC